MWLLPLGVTLFTASTPADRRRRQSAAVYAVAADLPDSLYYVDDRLLRRKSRRRKPRLKAVTIRTIVQCSIFMIWASVTSFCFIKGTRPDMLFWAMFHVFTVAMFPVFFGRVICGWICPNATLQDALYKNMTFKRPIENLPRAIDAQSSTACMNISGKVDVRAPLFPATLLLSWFPMFFAETVWDLTGVAWYPIAFMYGLIRTVPCI